jgi:Mrp family chromosome partitioning ATPase
MNGNGKGNGNGNGNGNGHRFSWRKWPSLWGHPRQNGYDLEPYRRIALRLNYDLIRPDHSRSVLVTTPVASTLSAPGSAALACSLAEELHRPVLIIDCSPGDPELSRILDCKPRKGFADLLSDPNLILDDFVLPTTHENVLFLPAGPSHAPFLAFSGKLGARLQEAEGRFDFVVLSGGAVLGDSTALALTPLVGCVLLLVTENQTLTEDLDAAQEALSFCKARRVGLVLSQMLTGGGSDSQRPLAKSGPTGIIL